MSDTLISDGGSKYPTLKFSDIGDTHTGTVLEVRKLEDRIDGVLKTWDNGDPKYVYCVTIQTGDDIGNIWARGQMVTVIREAGQAAKVDALVGVTLSVKYVGDGEQKNKAYHAPKLYKAKVEPAKPADVSTEEMW